jgi:hypothetical protein
MAASSENDICSEFQLNLTEGRHFLRILMNSFSGNFDLGELNRELNAKFDILLNPLELKVTYKALENCVAHSFFFSDNNFRSGTQKISRSDDRRSSLSCETERYHEAFDL